jgi:glyoxylate reductase
MRILYYSRTRQPEAETTLGAEYAELERLLRESDFVSLHVPLTPETRRLIGERELALMKPTAILVNAARGAIVDQRALYAALKERRIAAAGLDVAETEPIPPDEPLLTLDNVVITPHIGSASVATRRRMAEMAVESIMQALRGETPTHCVNPEALARQNR